MEKIEPGKFVELSYDLYEITPQGENLIYQTPDGETEKLIFGVTRGILPVLETTLTGMEQGAAFDVKADAKDAFGPVDPEQVATLEKHIFEIDGKFDADTVKPGAVVPMMTADGYRIDGKVLEVTGEHVKIDFNHPLAGKDVRFKGKITLVRDATEEELHPASCGCGCGHDNCGDHDSCGCGDHDHCGCGHDHK